jgi:hypothetical protein
VSAGQLSGTRGLDPAKGDIIRDGIVARAMVGGGGKLLLWDEDDQLNFRLLTFCRYRLREMSQQWSR